MLAEKSHEGEIQDNEIEAQGSALKEVTEADVESNAEIRPRAAVSYEQIKKEACSTDECRPPTLIECKKVRYDRGLIQSDPQSSLYNWYS